MKLFTKSCRRHFNWLYSCIRSVRKHCSDPLEWTVVLDQEGFDSVAPEWAAKHDIEFLCEEHEPLNDCLRIERAYDRQQWIKMSSHRVMGEGLYWILDCDVVATRPFKEAELLGDSGRSKFWFSDYPWIIKETPQWKNFHDRRIEVMKDIFSIKSVPFEMMRSMPIAIYGDILAAFHASPFAKKSRHYWKHGDIGASEFNIYGTYANLYHQSRYDWKNVESDGPSWTDYDGKLTALFSVFNTNLPMPSQLTNFINDLGDA